MSKKAKILVFFLLILLVLIFYLLLTSESVKRIYNSNPPASSISQPAGEPAKSQTAALSEDDSKLKVKEIFTAYEKLAADNSFTIEKITELKNKLFALRGSPNNFKDLQINFVLALNKMEDYLKREDQPARIASQWIVNKLKVDYSWLSN